MQRSVKDGSSRPNETRSSSATSYTKFKMTNLGDEMVDMEGEEERNPADLADSAHDDGDYSQGGTGGPPDVLSEKSNNNKQ